MEFLAIDCTVVRRGPFGDTVQMECPSWEVAQREAISLEREDQALQRAMTARAFSMGQNQRRAVRYFPNEETGA